MTDDKKVKIDVVTTANTEGAAQAAASLNKVEEAVEQAAAATAKNSKAVDFGAQSDRKAAVDKRDKGRAADTTTKKLNELGEATEKGANAGRVLGEVMRGNIGYVAQLGSSFKALGAAMKANVVGVVLIALTALWNLLPGLLERLGLLAKKTEETGKAAETAATQIAAFADTDAKFEKLTKRLGEVRDQVDEITQAVTAMRTATDAVDDAKLALTLAEIDRREAGALSDQNMPENERRRLKSQFDLERTGARQAAAEKRADDQSARAKESIVLNQRNQAGNVEEQTKLAIAQAEATRKLQAFIDDANRLNSMIASFGSTQQLPSVPETKQDVERRELVGKSKTELEPIMRAIAEGRAALVKIQAEISAAKKRGDQLGATAGPLRDQAVAAELNAEATRVRGQAAERAAANARQAANMAAIEAAQPGSTGPLLDPVTGRMPIYVPPPPPSFHVGGHDRSDLLQSPGAPRFLVDGKDRSDLLRKAASAEAAVQSAPSLDGLTGALSGLTTAIEQKAQSDNAAIRSIEQRVRQVEQNIRANRQPGN